MIWTREQAKALTDKALSFSKAEETQVILTGGDRANVRFARNSVTTAGASSGYSLAIVAKYGQKSGTVTASVSPSTEAGESCARTPRSAMAAGANGSSALT